MDRPLGAAPAFGGAWTSLNPPLTPWVMDVVANMGFPSMTPVQASSIPRGMKNQDLVVEAVTGSGKTLAYAIPILERIIRQERKYKKNEIAAIVIAPTRELATQIHSIFNLFLESIQPPPPEPTSPADPSSSRSPSPPPPPPEAEYPLPQLVTSGSKDVYEEFLRLKPSIIVGTPGRLASFLLSPRGVSLVRVTNFDVLVLDEADRLLSAADHRRDVEKIMKHLPKQRRTHLFSATMTDSVEELIGLGLRNPVRIVVNLKDKRKEGGEQPKERRTPSGLENTFLVCRQAEKTLQLIRLLQRETSVNDAAKFIVYFSTCSAVDYFYRVLRHLPALGHFHLTSFHGDLPPNVRTKALDTFSSHPSLPLSPSVMFCTDVAARGVDFPDVDVVIQYDAPTDPKTFSHRAGRTARAGRRGKAVLLVGKGREEQYIDFLEIRKIPLQPQPFISADLEELETLPTEIDAGAFDLMREMRSIVLTDRDLADKAAKSFVSSMKAYSKHEASFIFRVKDLDVFGLGVAYGLLRMPAMPEIKAWKRRREAQAKAKEAKITGDDNAKDPVVDVEMEEDVQDEVDWEDAMVDWDTFAYTSKPREATRLAALADKDKIKAERDLKRKARPTQAEAWSNQKDRKDRREDRRDKKDRKKKYEWEQKQKAEGVEIASKPEAADDEVEDFTEEYKQMKREARSERAAKKARKEEEKQGGGISVDRSVMFEGLS